MEGLFKYVLILVGLFLTVSGLEEVSDMTMDSFEKDKILSCLQIVSKKHQIDSKVIDELTNQFGPAKEAALTKISADMMSMCYNKISDETVSSIFNNLTFVDFDWSEEFDKVCQVDYSKYRTSPDLEPTPEQNILFFKLDKAKDDYMRATRERQEKAAKSFPPVFGVDLNEISPRVKLLYTVIVFALFAIGIVYALGKVLPRAKPKTNNGKKRN